MNPFFTQYFQKIAYCKGEALTKKRKFSKKMKLCKEFQLFAPVLTLIGNFSKNAFPIIQVMGIF